LVSIILCSNLTKQIRNPNIESGPADGNKFHNGKSEIRSTKEAPRTETNRGQNEFKIRKSQTPNPFLPVWNIVFVSNFPF